MRTSKKSTDNHFYISTGKRVARIAKMSGDVVWEVQLDGNLHYGSILLDDKFIIAAGHRQAACLDRFTGDIRWQTKIKNLSSPTSIALDKSTPGGLVILGCNGLVFALRADNGELLWENGLKGWGYNYLCLRVEGALTSVPKVQVVNPGNTPITYVVENNQE